MHGRSGKRRKKYFYYAINVQKFLFTLADKKNVSLGRHDHAIRENEGVEPKRSTKTRGNGQGQARDNQISLNDGGMDGEGECLPRKRRGAGVKAIALNVLLKAGDHRDKPGQTGTQ